jgi:DNA helicase-2/ATP-dependent DNA helicase PcrA
MRDVARWRDAAKVLSPAELVRQVLDESGYTDALQAEKRRERRPARKPRRTGPRDGGIRNAGRFPRTRQLVMDNEAATAPKSSRS